MKRIHVLGLTIAFLHALIGVPHGMAHSNLNIHMNLWQNIYILIVINLLPLVAAVLIWKLRRAGFLLLSLSMAGSFLFGVYYHFIADGPDNVASLPAHPFTLTFKVSAVLLAITEAAGFAFGLAGWHMTRRR